jgi:hypothetical protein
VKVSGGLIFLYSQPGNPIFIIINLLKPASYENKGIIHACTIPEFAAPDYVFPFSDHGPGAQNNQI